MDRFEVSTVRRTWIIMGVAAAVLASVTAPAGASARANPPGSGTAVFGLNARGVIVGTLYQGANGAFAQGFLAHMRPGLPIDGRAG